MKFALSFGFGALIGTLIGAVMALMFAPSSGEDLRMNIKSQLDEQSTKVKEQWQQEYQKLQNRVDIVSSDLQVLTKQNIEAKEEIEPAA